MIVIERSVEFFQTGEPGFGAVWLDDESGVSFRGIPLSIGRVALDEGPMKANNPRFITSIRTEFFPCRPQAAVRPNRPAEIAHTTPWVGRQLRRSEENPTDTFLNSDSLPAFETRSALAAVLLRVFPNTFRGGDPISTKLFDIMNLFLTNPTPAAKLLAEKFHINIFKWHPNQIEQQEFNEHILHIIIRVARLTDVLRPSELELSFDWQTI